MTTNIRTQDEIETFARKLQEFGDSLSPTEQALFARLLGEVDADSDVEGHLMGFSSWADARSRIGSILVQILEGMGTAAGASPLGPIPPYEGM